MEFLSYSNKGSKNINEDAYFTSDQFCIICDGVGGNAYGEVASKLAVDACNTFLSQSRVISNGSECITECMQYCFTKFKEWSAQHPETASMSTTIVLLVWTKSGVSIAWLGDSRLYHIRDKEIRFVTEDHSLLNELKQQEKDIDIDTLKIRNYITKSLQTNKLHAASYHEIPISEMQADDYFFICTDGVLENLTQLQIETFFTKTKEIDEISKAIKACCENKTKDNYSYTIIKLDK